MKFLKCLGIVLLTLVIITAVCTGLAILCKWLNWLPSVTEWIDVNIFDRLGLTFYSKI